MRRRFALISLCLLAAAGGAVGPANAGAKKPDPVLDTLTALSASGAPPAQVTAWRRLYTQGRIAVRHLRGAAQSNMRGVVANLGSLAQRGMLAGRASPAFLILQRNVDWFWTQRHAPVGFGTRTTFPGSELIYEFYPGSGWQLQPLANFGQLNGLLKLKRPRQGRLEAFADELLLTGVQREGFLAFEYYFPWSGGPPGWVSGMATATGMQAFAGLWKRDGDTRYLDAARSMGAVFNIGPPWGVRSDQPPGLFFLQYSQAPQLLVGNAYAQSILGLDSYATATGDAGALALVTSALAAARQVLPLYDTGGWSLYYRTPTAPGAESDLHYHELFASFLDQMCTRFQEPFCGLAANFHRYETEPVGITGLGVRADRRHRRLFAGFTISKRSSVTVSLSRSGKTVRGSTGQRFRGVQRVVWPLPPPGSYTLTVSARSLNGIRSEQSRPIKLTRR